MLASLFTETVSVERLTETEGSNIEEYTEHIATLACAIQPIDDTITQDLPGSFGKEWLLMCAPADIQEGDRVTWNAGEYRVTGVEQHDFAGETHTEARIRIFNS